MTIPAFATAVAPQTALTVGWITVILALILLAAAAAALIRSFLRRRAAKVQSPVAPAPAPEAAPAPAAQAAAPGSAGQLKLHDVEPRTAAMLLAIVAEKTGKPLNELRFISIKEVQ